jgi:hypothetical protein
MCAAVRIHSESINVPPPSGTLNAAVGGFELFAERDIPGIFPIMTNNDRVCGIEKE